MIVLDTNVASALMRTVPDEVVVRWLNRQPITSVWTSSVSLYEIQFGIEILAPGRKQMDLRQKLEMFVSTLGGRVLPLDAAAAKAASKIAAAQRNAGRSVEIRDVEIAGTVVAKDAVLATRNLRHFEGTGVMLVDPWASEL